MAKVLRSDPRAPAGPPTQLESVLEVTKAPSIARSVRSNFFRPSVHSCVSKANTQRSQARARALVQNAVKTWNQMGTRRRRDGLRRVALQAIERKRLETERKRTQEEERKKKDPPIQIFRRVARIVRLLCGVCLAIKQYAMDAGYLENWTVAVRRKGRGDDSEDVEDLTFNLKDFKIQKELMMPHAVQLMLDKRPEDRTPEDIQAIARTMRGLPSFRKYTRDMQEMLCKIIRYMRCGKRRVVLRKGHIGYNLYFIYTGAVSVVLDKDDGNVFVKKEVVILRKGACFGEIALLQDTRRNATIVCTEDTEFLVVEKDDFIQNGLGRQMEAEFTFRFNFFRSWSPFEHWSDDAIRGLSYVSRMEEFNHNKVIVRNSNKNEWMWFIIKGSCDILRLVDLQSCPAYQRLVVTDQNAERFFYSSSTKCNIPNKTSSRRFRSARSRQNNVRGNKSSSQLEQSKENEFNGVQNGGLERPKTSIGFRFHEGSPRESTSGSLTSHSSTSIGSRDSRVDTIIENTEETRRGQRQQITTENGSSEPAADVGCGIFVKVDTLRDGQCFGLEALFEEEMMTRATFSLISKGCEVIHVPRSRFKEIIDDQTLKNIRKMVRKYPSDDELCRKFIAKSKWDNYKQEVLETVVAEHQSNVAFEGSLRDSNRTKYLQRCRPANMTSPTMSQYSVISGRPSLHSSHYFSTYDIMMSDRKTAPRSITSLGHRRLCKTEHGEDSEEPTKRSRPRTCPPRFTSRQSPRPTLSIGRLPSRPAHASQELHSQDSTEERNAYTIQKTNVYASGSRRTLQLVQSLKSPSHENRMKLLKMK